MRKYLMILFAGLVIASCSNEESLDSSSGADKAPVVLKPDYSAKTRSKMEVDLINFWKDGDVLGLFGSWEKTGTTSYVNIGTQNAKYAYNATQDMFRQEGVQDVTWQDYSSPHNFYLYYPYVDGASKTAVPFTLINEQSQDTPDNFVAKSSGKYNFLWNSVKGATRPYNQLISTSVYRLLPVAQINIIRDNGNLDGYKLESVELKTTSATGGFKTGTVSEDLTTLYDVQNTTLTFTSGEADVQSYKVTTTPDNFKVSDLDLGRSFCTFISVNPCTIGAHQVIATFTDGTNTKVITADYEKTTFKSSYGWGYIVNYYLKASQGVKYDMKGYAGKLGEETNTISSGSLTDGGNLN